MKKSIMLLAICLLGGCRTLTVVPEKDNVYILTVAPSGECFLTEDAEGISTETVTMLLKSKIKRASNFPVQINIPKDLSNILTQKYVKACRSAGVQDIAIEKYPKRIVIILNIHQPETDLKTVEELKVWGTDQFWYPGCSIKSFYTPLSEQCYLRIVRDGLVIHQCESNDLFDLWEKGFTLPLKPNDIIELHYTD